MLPFDLNLANFHTIFYSVASSIMCHTSIQMTYVVGLAFEWDHTPGIFRYLYLSCSDGIRWQLYTYTRNRKS